MSRRATAVKEREVGVSDPSALNADFNLNRRCGAVEDPNDQEYSMDYSETESKQRRSSGRNQSTKQQHSQV